MSRGLGKLQRDLLQLLEQSDAPIDTFNLAADAYKLEPDEANRILLNNAQLAAVRRALTGLARAERIMQLEGSFRFGRAHWANIRVGLRYTIRKMQYENLSDGQDGRTDLVYKRMEVMLPLIRKAQELGVDYSG